MTRSNARSMAPFALFLMLASTPSRAADLIPETSLHTGRALVEILEFGDLMCPLTRISHSTLHVIKFEYGDLVQIEFRHAPFSRAAPEAARLAEAARRQRRLEPFLDEVALAPLDTDLEALAKTILEPRRLARDLSDPVLALEVERALALAKSLGLRGTPTFFVNGVPIEGAEPVSTFRPLIDALIATARQRHRAGPDWLDEQRRVHNRTLDDLLRGPPDAPSRRSAIITRDVARELPPRYIFPSPAPLVRAGDGPRRVTLFGDPTDPETLDLIAIIAAILPRDLSLEFRFALRDGHPEAPAYAALALCAEEQGRFSSFLEALHKAAPEAASPTRLIAETPLDTKRLLECLRSPHPNRLLAQHRAELDPTSIDAFPTLFLDGLLVELPSSTAPDKVVARLRAVIEGRQ